MGTCLDNVKAWRYETCGRKATEIKTIFFLNKIMAPLRISGISFRPQSSVRMFRTTKSTGIRHRENLGPVSALIWIYISLFYIIYLYLLIFKAIITI